jgi:hypothetical protein
LYVDDADLAIFAACWSGPAVVQADLSCRFADLDGDEDVDGADFGVFQRCVSGGGTVARP